MGYHSVNKSEIIRVHGDDRHIMARVYCDELGQWTEQRFAYERLDGALAWVESKMSQLSM
jgi:hypothetical protein